MQQKRLQVFSTGSSYSRGPSPLMGFSVFISRHIGAHLAEDSLPNSLRLISILRRQTANLLRSSSSHQITIRGSSMRTSPRCHGSPFHLGSALLRTSYPRSSKSTESHRSSSSTQRRAPSYQRMGARLCRAILPGRTILGTNPTNPPRSPRLPRRTSIPNHK